MWDLIVSVPDHCLSFYFLHAKFICAHEHYIHQENDVLFAVHVYAYEKRKTL